MFSTPKWDIDDIGANNSELFGTNFLHKAKKSKKERAKLLKIGAQKSANTGTNISNNINVHSKDVPSSNAQKNKDVNVSVKRPENNVDLKSLLIKKKKRKNKSRKLIEIGTSKPATENKNLQSQKKKHNLKGTVQITNAPKINFPVKKMGISLKRPDDMNAILSSTDKKRIKIIPKNETVASVQKAEPISLSKRKRKRKHSPSINTNSLQLKIKKKKLNESHMNNQLISQSGTEEKNEEDIKQKSSKQEKKRRNKLKKKMLEKHNDMSTQANNEVDSHVPHQTSEIRKLPFSIHKLKNVIATSRNVNQSERENLVSRKQDKKPLSLRERMMRRLKASRFRYINEQLYTSDGKDAKTYFQSDPEAFVAYHEGYKQQIKQWPINPLDVIIKSLKKKSSELVVADFGCGDARLARSIQNKVHSFDLVAASEEVTACNMSHTPLSNASVDIVVFCLSLMGNNLSGYISEANRVLKEGGLLMIAEVESRFESVEVFIQSLQKFGFVNTWKDLSYNLFYFMNFKKEKCISKKMKSKLPELTLKPCLYKKR